MIMLNKTMPLPARGGEHYDEAATQTAHQRTLALFAANLG